MSFRYLRSGGSEARRHNRVGCGGDAGAELVRHVDHAHPLHAFMGVDPLDEALLIAQGGAESTNYGIPAVGGNTYEHEKNVRPADVGG